MLLLGLQFFLHPSKPFCRRKNPFRHSVLHCILFDNHKDQLITFYFCSFYTSVQPKPYFGIGNRNRGPISVLEPNLFLTKLFFSFPTSWGIIKAFFVFERLKLNFIYKNNIYFFFGSNFGFRGTFTMGKNTPYYQKLESFL